MKALFFHNLRSKKKSATDTSSLPSADPCVEVNSWTAIGGNSFVQRVHIEYEDTPLTATRWAATVLHNHRSWTQARERNYQVCCRPHSFVDVWSDAVAEVCKSIPDLNTSHANLLKRLQSRDSLAPIEALLYQSIHRRLCDAGVPVESSVTLWPTLTSAVRNYISRTPFSLPVGRMWSTRPHVVSRRLPEPQTSAAATYWTPTAELLVVAWADLISCLREPIDPLEQCEANRTSLWGEEIFKVYPMRHIAVHAPICLADTGSSLCPTFESTLFSLQNTRAAWTQSSDASLALEGYILHLNTHLQLVINQIAYGSVMPALATFHWSESVAAAAATLLLINYVDRTRMMLPSRFKTMLLPHIHRAASALETSVWTHLNISRTLEFISDPLKFVSALGDEHQIPTRTPGTPPVSPKRQSSRRTIAKPSVSSMYIKNERKVTTIRRSLPSADFGKGTSSTPLGLPPTISSPQSSLYCTLGAGKEVAVNPGDSLFLLAAAVSEHGDSTTTTIKMRMEDIGEHVRRGSAVFSYALCTKETLTVRRHILGVAMLFTGSPPCYGVAFDYCSGTLYRLEWDKWADLSTYVVCGLETALIQRRNMPGTYSLSYNSTEVIVSAQHKIRARTTLADTAVPEAIRLFVILEMDGVCGTSMDVRKYQTPPPTYHMHAHLMDTPWMGNPGKILFSEAFHCRKFTAREADAFSNCVPYLEPLNGAVVPGAIVTIKAESADDEEPIWYGSTMTPKPKLKPKPHRTRRSSDSKGISSASSPVAAVSSHPKSRVERIEVAQRIWHALLDNPGMPTCPWCQVPAFGIRYYHPRKENDKKSLGSTMNRRNHMQTLQMSSKTLRAMNAVVVKMESGALGRLQKFRQSEAGIRGRT